MLLPFGLQLRVKPARFLMLLGQSVQLLLGFSQPFLSRLQLSLSLLELPLPLAQLLLLSQ